MNKEAIILIVFAAVITYGMRSLTFIFFAGDRKMPDWLTRLGKVLPSTIMAVLIVYCLKDLKTDFTNVGIPQLTASVVVVVTYKLKHSTFISILAGTVCNMVLIGLL